MATQANAAPGAAPTLADVPPEDRTALLEDARELDRREHWARKQAEFDAGVRENDAAIKAVKREGAWLGALSAYQRRTHRLPIRRRSSGGRPPGRRSRATSRASSSGSDDPPGEPSEPVDDRLTRGRPS